MSNLQTIGTGSWLSIRTALNDMFSESYTNAGIYSKDFTSLSSLGGSGAIYINSDLAIKQKAILNNIRIKAPIGSNVTIYIYNVTGTSGSLIFTFKHTYTSFITTSLEHTQIFTDNFIINAGDYIGILSNQGFYYTTATGGAFAVGNGNTQNITCAYDFSVINVPASKMLGKTILLAGDSVSSTDYTWYANNMTLLTRANVIAGGASGQPASYLASNTYIQTIFDANPNLIISLFGGNDDGAANSVGTFTNISGEPVVTETDISQNYSGTYYIQAISHFIRKIKANYYNIRTRANLTESETEAQKNAKIDAVLKPELVFISGLPQQRNNSSDSFSQSANWLRKVNAVKECCIKYNIRCIDLFTLFNWDMSVEPYWTSPTNKTTNNGVYFMDGLHPNQFGYEINSKLICRELGLL